MENIALVVGATGITGSNLAEQLSKKGWTTYDLARNPDKEITGLKPISAGDLKAKLADIAPTHIFITSGMRNDTEAENIRSIALSMQLIRFAYKFLYRLKYVKN